MGQEILYCWKCNSRILGSEFEKGSAFQVGGRSSCAACASELLATLPAGEREKLLAKMFKSTHERGGTSRSMGRVAPPTSVPVRRRPAFPAGFAAGVAGAAVLLVVIVIVLLSGGSPPPPEPPPKPPEPPPVSERETRARAAIAKAREAGRSRPEDVDTLSLLWQEALWASESSPSLLEEARREYALVSAKLGKEENELRALVEKEEFRKALDFLQTAKRREWAEKKAVETREVARRLFPGLKERALAGEAKAVEERVAKWGLEEYAAELRKALKEVEGLIRPAEDGLICVEAEAFHGKEDKGEHAWTRVTDPPGAAGGAAMAALPDTGKSIPTNYAARAARLDYRIHFPKAGTYQVWLRARGSGDNGDSVHVGLDGQEIPSGQSLSLPRNWGWVGKDRAAVAVGTPGPHTIHLWMREDGAVIDRIVLSPNPSWSPKDEGPPASPR